MHTSRWTLGKSNDLVPIKRTQKALTLFNPLAKFRKSLTKSIKKSFAHPITKSFVAATTSITQSAKNLAKSFTEATDSPKKKGKGKGVRKTSSSTDLIPISTSLVKFDQGKSFTDLVKSVSLQSIVSTVKETTKRIGQIVKDAAESVRQPTKKSKKKKPKKLSTSKDLIPTSTSLVVKGKKQNALTRFVESVTNTPITALVQSVKDSSKTLVKSVKKSIPTRKELAKTASSLIKSTQHTSKVLVKSISQSIAALRKPGEEPRELTRREQRELDEKGIVVAPKQPFRLDRFIVDTFFKFDRVSDRWAEQQKEKEKKKKLKVVKKPSKDHQGPLTLTSFTDGPVIDSLNPNRGLYGKVIPSKKQKYSTVYAPVIDRKTQESVQDHRDLQKKEISPLKERFATPSRLRLKVGHRFLHPFEF